MKRLGALVVVAFLALVACSSAGNTENGAGGSAQAAADDGAPFELDAAPVATTDVGAVKSYKFDPQVIEITTGSEVTWSNEDDFPHNVHFLTGMDDTYDLPIGESASVGFDEPGDFYYECSLHPQQMRGKVIVTS